MTDTYELSRPQSTDPTTITAGREHIRQHREQAAKLDGDSRRAELTKADELAAKLCLSGFEGERPRGWS